MTADAPSLVPNTPNPWYCMESVLSALASELYVMDAHHFTFTAASHGALASMNLSLEELRSLGLQDVFHDISPSVLQHQISLYQQNEHVVQELFPHHHVRNKAGIPFKLLYIKDQYQQVLVALPAYRGDFRGRASKMERIVAHIPCLVFELLQDQSQQIAFKFLSNSCETLLGLPESALLDNPGRLLDIIQQEDRESFLKSMARAAHSQTAWNWEGGIRIEKWQDTKLINLRASPVPFDDGRILWHGIMTNISNSNSEKFALSHIVARFKTIVASIPSMVFESTLNSQGELRFNYVSESSKSLLDLSPEALQQSPALLVEMILPTDRERFHRSMRRSARELSIWNWEGAIWMEKWQDIKTVNLRATPTLNARGEIQWGGLISNITQSKSAQLALDEISTRFQAIVANIPSLVFQCHQEADGQVVFNYLSDNCQPLLGINIEDLTENPGKLLERILPEDRASFVESMRQSAKDLDIWNWEGRLWIEDWQDVKVVNLRASASKNADDQVVWGGVITNITQSQREKMEIEASHQRLEELSSQMALIKEQEQLRIAREIHDNLGGNLTSIKMGLASLIRSLPDTQPELRDKATQIEGLVDQTFEEAHRITADLRPSVLELGIVAALEWQAREFEKQHDIPFEFSTSDEDIDLDVDQAIVLFRICQEACSNIIKYAKANVVEVSLHRSEDAISMTILDDGIGIKDEDKLKKNSFGLRGMVERVQAVGGEISIGSGETHGTRIWVRLPL